MGRSRFWRAFRIAYSEMFDFAGFESRAANAVLAPFFVVPTVLFVLRLLGLDRRLKSEGVPAAMGWILSRYYGGMQLVSGTVPARGPLLLVGNHPGLGDLPALAVAAGRRDLVAVAKQRDLMRDMHGVLDRCIIIDDSLASRAAAVRAIIEHFKHGGAVVVYPAGEIEPDPAVFNDTPEFLRDWPPVVDGILRRVQRESLSVPVVPVYTEGVHHVPALLRWLIRPGVSEKAREGRAALITMITRLARTAPIRLAVGDPLHADASIRPPARRSATPAIRSSLHDLEQAVQRYRPNRAVRRPARYSAGGPASQPGLYPVTAPEVSPRTTPR